MKRKLSVIMITLNAQELLHRSLSSVISIADELIVVDAGSTDNTMTILGQFKVKIYKAKQNHLGKNKAKALALATGDLILSLDADEVLSSSLVRIIRLIKHRKNIADGYVIQFHNHYLGRRLRYGGEDYKMMRLFKKNKVQIAPLSVHESFELKTKKKLLLKAHIDHFSYRSLFQMYKKFSVYAMSEAKERLKKGDRSSLKKLILNPPHMFWARFFKDKGYRDGVYRIPLDLGFAYMEFITYLSLGVRNLKK